MSGLLIIFITFVVLLILNVPIAYALGLSGIVYIITSGSLELTSFVSIMVNGLDSFPLLAVPFFILAGAIMDAGGISRRIVDFASALVGPVKGGLAMVAVISCAFFAALSGSGIATTAAIGAIMIPQMAKAGYNEAFSAALIAASGCLGPIIPPSVPMVLYGASTDTSVTALLIGGLLPGLLLAALLMGYAYFYAKKWNIGSDVTFSLRNIGSTFIKAIPALLVPVIILGGIYSGTYTPTEAAAIAVVYSFLVGTFLYKEATLKKLKAALIDSSTQVGTFLIIAACAVVFARMLTMEQFHQVVQTFALSVTDNKIVVLLVLNIILLILGALMDTVPIILIFAPILVPIAVSFGVNPVHFGVMMCINLAIGLITPPVGISLYVAAGQAKLHFSKIVVHIWPLLLVLITGLLAITYWPAVVTFLPRLSGIM